MKKFLKDIIGFSGLAVLLYLVFIVLWGSVMPRSVKKNLGYEPAGGGHVFTRLQEVKTVRNVDILFLGSSHTYRGFDTRMWADAGYSTFNLGSSSQTPLQTQILLDRYLEQLNPKLVIYEVYPANFSSDGVESTMELLANDRIDAPIRKLAIEQSHINLLNTLIYGQYRQTLGLNEGISEARVKGEDRYVSGGFVEKDIRHYTFKKQRSKTWELKEEQFEVFEEIIESLTTKGHKILLVQAPITPARYNSYTNNEVYDNRMKDQASYMNFNEILALHDTLHFYDSHHMNQLGVEIFNSVLIDSLRERNLSPESLKSLLKD